MRLFTLRSSRAIGGNSLAHQGNAFFVLPLYGQHPTTQNHAHGEKKREFFLASERSRLGGPLLDRVAFSPLLIQLGGNKEDLSAT